MDKNIQTYNDTQLPEDKEICELLCGVINEALANATSKLWHGHPVWFLDENPIVGYSKRKNSVTLLFWSGQSFDEKGLLPEGTFKAAEVKFTHKSQVNVTDLKRWLDKSGKIQWDYKNIVKRRGKLEKLLG
jgi:hypothetical protein